MRKHLDSLITRLALEDEVEDAVAIALEDITVDISTMHLPITTRREGTIMAIEVVITTIKITTRVSISQRSTKAAEEDGEATSEEVVVTSRAKCMRTIPMTRISSRRMKATRLLQWRHVGLILAPEPCQELLHEALEARMSSEGSLSHKVSKSQSHLEDSESETHVACILGPSRLLLL